MLSIAMASTYPPIHCGVGEYTRLLLTGIRGRAPQARLLVLAEEGVGEGGVDEPLQALVVPAFRRGDPGSLSRALDALAEHGGVDILHFQHEYGIFGCDHRVIEAAVEARRERLARRIVFTLHTVYTERASRSCEHGFQQALLGAVDAVVVHSSLQEFELINQAGGYTGILHRIPHGTSVNPFLGTPRTLLADYFGLDHSLLEGRVVSFFGFLRPDKGLDTLWEALRILAERGVRLNVLIAGEPPPGESAPSFDSLPGHSVAVIPRYLSPDEILRLAALSDVIVLPYKDPPGKYAVSGVLHLSMGSMKPVIGSRVPRLVELYTLTPRLTFPPGDAPALAGLLGRFADEGLYDLLIPYAGPLYSYAVRTSWERVALRHLNLYHRLLASG